MDGKVGWIGQLGGVGWVGGWVGGWVASLEVKGGWLYFA